MRGVSSKDQGSEIGHGFPPASSSWREIFHEDGGSVWEED